MSQVLSMHCSEKPALLRSTFGSSGIKQAVLQKNMHCSVRPISDSWVTHEWLMSPMSDSWVTHESPWVLVSPGESLWVLVSPCESLWVPVSPSWVPVRPRESILSPLASPCVLLCPLEGKKEEALLPPFSFCWSSSYTKRRMLQKAFLVYMFTPWRLVVNWGIPISDLYL